MIEYFKKLLSENPKIRKVIGALLVIIGFVSILTPFTPVGFLLIIGLEMLGLRFLIGDKIGKIKDWLRLRR